MPFSFRRSSLHLPQIKSKPRVIYGKNFEPRNALRIDCSSSSRLQSFSHISQLQQPVVRTSVVSGFTRGTNVADYSETPKLNRILTKEEIKQLYEIFQQNGGQKFNQPELRDLLERFKIYYTDDEFQNLFLKINTNRDDLVEWDELISYILLEFEVDEGDKDKESLDPPIKEHPSTRKTHHRHQIVRIDFYPTVSSDREVSMEQGGYVVTATDGTVNFYSLNWDLLRVGKSPSPFLKVASTYVKDAICMPDVRVMCIASTERDLRFYDTTANNYALRLHIIELPDIINTLHYYFSPHVKENSKLTIGDSKGVIYLLEFNAEARGPFCSTSGAKIFKFRFSNVMQNETPFIYREFKNLHDDIVRQVCYVPSMDCILSAAENKNPKVCGLYMLDLGIKNDINGFIVEKGVTCFCFDETSETIATGGLDCIVRLWSPYSPQKPFCVLPGHLAGISFIFLQDQGKKCYSLDKEKTIRVWDCEAQCPLQTYTYLMQTMKDKVPLKSFYNDVTRELIIGAGKFVLVKCCPLLRLDLTDGNTHTRPVSVVLYNHLFEVVITCGFDSFIIVWDPWTGARLNLIKMAHSRMLHGEMLRLEITAACFDPKHQLLLTGATDGTLKVWNFNNGFCVRNLSIGSFSEITAVFWVPDRILAVGWNKFVVEFADGVETEFPNGKHWNIQHSEEILCAAARAPHALVTTSYNGEIVFWKFETGQAYRKFNVEEPLTPKQVFYGLNESQPKTMTLPDTYKRTHRLTLLPQYMLLQNATNLGKSDTKTRKLSVIALPTEAVNLRQLSIQAVLFLESRPMDVKYGSLLTSLDNGKVLVWSHHPLGGFIKQFNAIHMAGDSVSTMSTDETNTYLFTGTTLGYVKTWLLTNFCTPEDVHVPMPYLRLTFPFLIKTAFLGRAKRSVKDQPLPMLLNSYKAHRRSITSIAYMNKNELLLTASSDKSARLWTLGGQYLGTFGSPVSWKRIIRNQPYEVNPEKKNTFRIPPDIKRDISFTTLQVLTNGGTHPVFKKKIELKEDEEETMEQKKIRKCIYGKSLKEPILGKHFKFPERSSPEEPVTLDTSLKYVPIYSHLKIHELEQKGSSPFVNPNMSEINIDGTTKQDT